jgi:hypothetical protein
MQNENNFRVNFKKPDEVCMFKDMTDYDKVVFIADQLNSKLKIMTLY